VNIFQRWKQTALHNKALVLTGAIVALGTIVSTGTALFQVYMAKQDSRNTSQQIDNLIAAARIQAGAASAFADSAARINTGIGSAVEKLNLQAAATSRLSKDSETANNNVLEADRPWMGAVVSEANFELGKRPVFSIVFTNTGKRPARVDLTSIRTNWYLQFPTNPDREYIFDATPSTSVVVPGQGVSSVTEWSNPMAQLDVETAATGPSTFFIFGKIEYRDLKTNESFWTHVCVRYMPTMKTDTDNGFRNCAQYNDAK
jgi:hypothetical protein